MIAIQKVVLSANQKRFLILVAVVTAWASLTHVDSVRQAQLIGAGLEALINGEIRAFVYDEPVLRYRINQEFQGRLDVLPHSPLYS